MDIPVSQITYHSRKRDNQGYIAYMPQRQKQQVQTTQFSTLNNNKSKGMDNVKATTTQARLLNNNNNNMGIKYVSNQYDSHNNNKILSFSYLQEHPQSQNINITSKQQSKLLFQQQHLSSYSNNNKDETKLLKQEIKSLKLHLKSAIESNNQAQQKYNQLKSKINQKETEHINQMAVMRAELIILNKENQENVKLMKKKDELISQLKQRVGKSQENDVKIKDFVMKENNYVREIKRYEQQVSKMTLNIQQLNTIIKQQKHQIQAQTQSISSKQDQQATLKTQIQTLKQINTQMNNNFKQLQKQNESIYSKNQELNCYIKQVCSNTEHLYQEIKSYKQQIQEIKQELNKKQIQKSELIEKLNSVVQNIESYENKYDELKINHDIIQEQYRQLNQKYINLQQSNLQTERNNTELLREMSLMQQEIKELKGLCIQQERKETELNQIVSGLETELDKIIILKNREEERFVGKNNTNVVPTRDRNRIQRAKTEAIGFNEDVQAYDRNKYYQQTKNSFYNIQDNNKLETNKYNYLSNLQLSAKQQNLPQSNKSSTILPYTQYLSFEPSNPYAPNKLKKQTDVRKRVYTSVDDVDYQSNYNNPYTKNQKLRASYHNDHFSTTGLEMDRDRKNKSLYLQKTHQGQAPQNSLYKSYHQNNMNSSLYNSLLDIKNPRSSLDLKRNTSNRSILKSQNTLNSNIYESQYPLDNHNSHNPLLQIVPQEQKRNIISKLDKIKMWTKQTTSQNTTQREAFEEISEKNISNMNYLNKQASVQAIIKQKSKGVLQQRKNLFNLNINNHMIQKNMLKLQKNSAQNFLNSKPQSSILSKNYMQKNQQVPVLGSTIYKQSTGNSQRNKQNNLNYEVYKSCKKTLYQN